MKLLETVPRSVEDARVVREDPVAFAKSFFAWEATPAQALIMRSKADVVVAACGRRFGKSESWAASLAWFAVTRPKSHQFVVSLSQDQASLIFDQVNEFFASSKLASLVKKVVWTPFPLIVLGNGSKIYARSTSNNGRYLRGRKAHRVVVDEAALVKDGVVNEVVRPMLADFDGQLVLISTPFGHNYFYEEWLKGKNKEPGYESFQFTSFDNPHISHAYVQKLRARMTELEFQTEILAEFIDDQNFVFKWSVLADAIEDYELKYEPEKNHAYVMGVDLAKVKDYYVAVLVDVTDPKANRVVFVDRAQGIPYSEVASRVRELIARFQPLKVFVDQTGVGEAVVEAIAMNEFPQVEGLTFSMPTKITLINELKLLLERRKLKLSVELPDELVTELKFFEYRLTRANNVQMEAASGHHDDFVIALSLAAKAIPKEYDGEFGCEGVAPGSVKASAMAEFVRKKARGEDSYVYQGNEGFYFYH